MIQGLDVSKWQGDMDWAKAWAAGARFCIIKCSESASYQDPKFPEFYQGARDAGMAVSAYHFFRATVSGEAQAVNIRNAIGDRVLDLPVAIDVELFDNVTPALATSRLQNLLYELLDYKGHPYPMIYTSCGLWNPHILTWSGWRYCPLWVANWSVPVPRLPRDWTDYLIWQTGKELGSKWGATSREIDVNQWNEAYPFLVTTTPPVEPPPAEPDLASRVRVSVDGVPYKLVKE
jgi:lysozyme